MWADIVKMDLREIELGGIYWFDLARDRNQCMTLVNTAINLWVP
jgi:hypothetical protein